MEAEIRLEDAGNFRIDHSEQSLTVCVVNPNYFRSSGVTVAIRGIFQGSANLPVRWVFVDCREGDVSKNDTSWIEQDERKPFLSYLPLMSFNPLRVLLAMWRLLALLRQERVDVLHVHHRRLALIAGWVAKLSGIPVVFTSHGPQPDRKWFRLAPIDRATGVTASMCDNIRETTRMTSPMEISNPVAPAMTMGSGRGQKGVVLCVGRFDEQKNHKTLLSAWAMLDPVSKGYRLRLAGEGPLRSSMEQRALELGIMPSIDFLGFVSNVRQHMHDCAFLVLPSWYEGQGIVTLEGALEERPSLVTDVDGSRDCIPPGSTLPNLVDPARPESIAEALAVWLENPALVAQEGKRFATYWGQRCDPQRIARAYFEQYRAAASGLKDGQAA